jgi:hypothetical protein
MREREKSEREREREREVANASFELNSIQFILFFL